MKRWHRVPVVCGALLLVVGCTATVPPAEESPPASSGAAGPSLSESPDSVTTTQSPDPATLTTPATGAPLALNPTIIILDASGSMKADDAPGPRIDAANNAVLTLVDGLPDGAPLGLIVYGTGTDSSDAAQTAGCQDIKTLVPLAAVDKATFAAAVNGVAASGYTPIGAALRAAAAELPASGPRNIVIVSDGEDTCAPPGPCEVAKDLGAGVGGLAVHAVGFRVSGAAKDQLTCIAKAGSGSYVDAANAVQLQARLRSATDPNAAVNTLTSTGYSGMQIGMTVAQAKGVDPSISADSTGTVTIVWRDCDLTFTDGSLVTIAPHTAVPTQDGLAVGDDVSKAGQLYGSAAPVIASGRSYAIFAAAEGGEVGYDVTFTPDAANAGQLSGPVRAIVMCRCKPAQSAASAVDADAFLKTPGRWWFRTPDDAWACSITTQIFCESSAWNGNKATTYPPPTGQDYEQSGAEGGGTTMGGFVWLTNAEVTYGTGIHGDRSEFYYDVNNGVPGPGKTLADGQVLTAGGYRCFVTGFAVTCSTPTTGIGFTVSQDAYLLYPRDGTAPEPGQPVLKPTTDASGADVIGPDGYENLRLGMTFSQAQQADPTLAVTSTSTCLQASTKDAERVVFNPDGGLAYIEPRGSPHTPEGLRVGDTADKAFTLYAPDRGGRDVSMNYSSNQFPVLPGSEAVYIVRVSTPNQDAIEVDAVDATVTNIYLDGGQRCFS